MATALLLVDVQHDMLLTPSVLTTLRTLLSRARNEGARVVHVRSGGQPLRFGSWPDEPVIDRVEEDAFLGTALDAALPPGSRIALGGVWSEQTVAATALAALERGYRVVLAAGAHEGFAPESALDVEHALAEAGVVVAEADAIPFG